MTKLSKLLFLVFLAVSIQEIIAFSNGITGYYGNTLGGSCRSCHGGISGGVTDLSINIPTSGIVANGMYLGSIRAKNVGSKIFGITFVAQDAPMNTCGQLIPFNTAQTQEIVGNLTHQKDGGLSNDSILFKFWWKAPSILNGHDVTFKWNVLCADNDGTTSGDVVANGMQAFIENPNAVISQQKTQLKLFPNPVQSVLNVVGLEPIDKIFIYDESGKLVFYQSIQAKESIDISVETWKSGSYFMKTSKSSLNFLKK
jgi:hypothetical protein